MKTERMTILVTPEQKAAISARAQRLGLSAGEMVRRAVESSDTAKAGVVSEEGAVLNVLAEELFAAAKSARAALIVANKEVQATLRQLAKRRQVADGGV